MHATAAAVLAFARRNRLHICRIAAIAAIHAALLWLTWSSMVGRHLDNTFTQIFTLGLASPAKETAFNHVNDAAALILSQPLWAISEFIPGPQLQGIAAEVLGYALIALNSLFWGIAIYAASALIPRTKRSQSRVVT